MIKAFLFDVDGVLADTVPISKKLTTAFYRSKGYDMTEDIVGKYLGIGMRELFAAPGREIGVTVDYDEAMAYFKAHYTEYLHKNNPALPGGADLVHMAKKAGIKCAVGSSAPLWRVQENLEAVGIGKDEMDYIVHGDMVKRNKPFGDIYQSCLIAFGIDGKEAIVFEDAPGGMAAGKNAGCWVCALTTSVNREKARKSGADAIISDLSQFPSFSTMEELDAAFRKMRRIGPNAVKYGANWITPLERKMPQNVIEKEATKVAFAARDNAYAPYSHFKVGAAVVSAATGRIYPGCNTENVSYSVGLCAERNAITTAVTNEGAVGLDLVVVASGANPPALPCAACLQMMSEFCHPETPVLLVNTEGVEARYLFKDLLPHAFSFGEEDK